MTETYSRLDLGRRTRIGMIEAIFGEYKTVGQLTEILKTLDKKGELALVTRIQKEKAETLMNTFKSAKFHLESNCLTLGIPIKQEKFSGEVIVLGGGTSDLSVAAEAELSLRLHGIKTKLLLDVGVAGLERLLSQLELLKQAKVLIACAGMEGSLPIVLSGLVPQPVIGVPVSVGYGVSFNGKTALAGMLSSCAPGLVVVNIDNGYGAAMAALRILNSD